MKRRPKIGVFLVESPWGSLDPSLLDKGLGGRETALIYLVMSWAMAGADVYAFVPREDTLVWEDDNNIGGDVRWIPYEGVIDISAVIGGYDLFVSWENAEVVAALQDAEIPMKWCAIEMQVAHLHTDIQLKELGCNVAVLSDWARKFFLKQHPDMAGRVAVLPNGVDLARFKESDPGGIDGIVNFIYSSSPDRGLHHLLKMWPDIRLDVEREYGAIAFLNICYGIESFVDNLRWSHREDGLRALEIENLIAQEGIQYHGKIGQDKLAQMMTLADAMLYPADTMSPTETGCISIVEALAASTPVVTTDCDCIGPEFAEVTTQCPLPLNYEDYRAAIIDTLNPEDYVARQEAGVEFAKKRDWKIIAQEWLDFFNVEVERVES